MVLESREVTFSQERGAIDGLWGHMGACTRKRGAFETFRSVSDVHDYGQVQKRGAV